MTPRPVRLFLASGVAAVAATALAVAQTVTVPYNAAAYGGPSPWTAADVKRHLDNQDVMIGQNKEIITLLRGGHPAAAGSPEQALAAVAKQHCFRCHSAEKADERGDGFAMFDKDGGLLKLKPFEVNRVRQTVLEGSMPKTGPKPTPAERAVFEAMK